MENCLKSQHSALILNFIIFSGEKRRHKWHNNTPFWKTIHFHAKPVFDKTDLIFFCLNRKNNNRRSMWFSRMFMLAFTKPDDIFKIFLINNH